MNSENLLTIKDLIPEAKIAVRDLVLPNEILSRLNPARISAVISKAVARHLGIAIEDTPAFALGLEIEEGWDWRMDMTVWEVQLGNELCDWWRQHGESKGGSVPAGGEAKDGQGDGGANPVQPGRNSPDSGQVASAGAGTA